MQLLVLYVPLGQCATLFPFMIWVLMLHLYKVKQRLNLLRSFVSEPGLKGILVLPQASTPFHICITWIKVSLLCGKMHLQAMCLCPANSITTFFSEEFCWNEIIPHL